MHGAVRTAVLMLTHRLDRFCLDGFERLRTEGPPGWDYFLLCDDATPVPADTVDPGTHHIFRFRFADMAARGYSPIARTIVPGSTHWGMFHFALTHPEYDHVWQVEYDVTFTGIWRSFFDAQSETADLLSAHILPFSAEPLWHWWSSLEHLNGPLPDALWRSFNPIFRLSRRAVEHLDQCFRQGWRGHYEVAMATLLVAAHMTLEEIGGGGPFVRPGNEGRFYTPWRADPGSSATRTLRWRPAWAEPLAQPNTLYHPVKSSARDTGGYNQGA